MSEKITSPNVIWEVTSAATPLESARVAIVDPDGLILVVQRALTSSHNAGMWEVPGGQVEPGETYEQAAVREVRQETGIVLDHVNLGPALPVDCHVIDRGKHQGKLSVTHGFLAFVGMSDVKICQESMASSWQPRLPLLRRSTTTPVTKALLRELF